MASTRRRVRAVYASWLWSASHGRVPRPMARRAGDDNMRRLRALTDRLIGRLVPEVTASALWITQRRCAAGCGRWSTQTRQCHDGSGYCTPWQTVHCDC